MFGNFIIIGKDCAAITIGTKRFGRKKACAGDIGKLANRFAMPCRAKALRGVINQPQAIFTGEIANRGIIGGLAKQPDSDNANNIDTGGSCQRQALAAIFLDQG